MYKFRMLTALLCLLVMSSVFTAFKTADATLPAPASHETIKANPALFGFRLVDKAQLAASPIIAKFGPHYAAAIETLTADFNVFINEATNTLHIQRKIISATAGKSYQMDSDDCICSGVTNHITDENGNELIDDACKRRENGSVLNSALDSATLSPGGGVFFPGGVAYLSGKGTIVVKAKYVSDFDDAVDELPTAWIH